MAAFVRCVWFFFFSDIISERNLGKRKKRESKLVPPHTASGWPKTKDTAYPPHPSYIDHMTIFLHLCTFIVTEKLKIWQKPEHTPYKTKETEFVVTKGIQMPPQTHRFFWLVLRENASLIHDQLRVSGTCIRCPFVCFVLANEGLDLVVIGRFHTRGRIIRLNELGQTYVVRLVTHLYLKNSERGNQKGNAHTFFCGDYGHITLAYKRKGKGKLTTKIC